MIQIIKITNKTITWIAQKIYKRARSIVVVGRIISIEDGSELEGYKKANAYQKDDYLEIYEDPYVVNKIPVKKQ